MSNPLTTNDLKCAHCGTAVGSHPVADGREFFCCEGCKTVYRILKNNDLCEYYDINPGAGRSLKDQKTRGWNGDELNLMKDDFVVRNDKGTTTILLYIPSMHCSSCIWLLEKLPDLNRGILLSRVDFIRKQVSITYNEGEVSFGQIVQLLGSLGYEPSLMPEAHDSGLKERRGVLIKLGVAGFCAGNIMLFSFPQYFGLDKTSDPAFTGTFNILNILFSIPLVFYSGSEYFKALYQWFALKVLSVKVPLAIGIGTLWVRSVYEVLSLTGSGYFDSLAGLVFFLLAGTWLQNRTFDALRFGEKARHFFPLIARVVKNGETTVCKVNELKAGDRVILRSGDIVPADGILMNTEATVEYSFATGESDPKSLVAGEMVFCGGRNAGGVFEMEVIKPFNESKLSDIWQSAEFENGPESKVLKSEAVISKYFIIATVSIALGAFIYWLPTNQAKAWFAFTSVLMVACPCALALAPPFAFNIVSSFLAERGLFLRKPNIAGILGEADHIVFDKTGTLTQSGEMLAVIPEGYNSEDQKALRSLAVHSNHPYSRAIDKALAHMKVTQVSEFKEKAGQGIEAYIGEKKYRLGSAFWAGDRRTSMNTPFKRVWFNSGGRILDPILITDVMRNGVAASLKEMKEHGTYLHLASGDEAESVKKLSDRLEGVFASAEGELKPGRKAAFVRRLKSSGTVVMIGDGINDAGALRTGHAGISVVENTTSFAPESSALLLESSFSKLPMFMQVCRSANQIIKETFVVSLIYNISALTLAITGKMSPVIAAILMPTSSVILMLFAWARTKIMVKREAGK